MSASSDSSQPPVELLTEAIRRLEEVGFDALEEFLAEQPVHAVALRNLLRSLDHIGMVVGNATDGDAMPGQIGEFVIKERLGKGGMGVVYLAEQPALQREVAIKLIRPDYLFFPRARERFQREIAAIARLQHPSIVRVYSAETGGEVPYFTMERVEGVSLDQLIGALRPGTLERLGAADVVAELVALGAPPEALDSVDPELSWAEICVRWLRDLADAVRYAHDHDVLHRDIKPSNVMITWSMRAMLLDFGLASTAGEEPVTRTGTQLGSLPYMAPEQVRGETSAIDCRTDVYALGVLLYELLTLHRPFHGGGDSEEALRRRIVSGETPLVRAINRSVTWEAEMVCRRAMAPESDQRYPTAAALGEDLQNLLSLRPIQARRPGPRVWVRRYVRRHPALAGAGAMALLSLILAPTAFAIGEFNLRTQISAEQSRTQEEVRVRDDMLDFFREELLGVASPEELGKDVTMRAALDHAAKRVDGRFPDRPRIEAALRSTIGHTYRSLGELELAEHHLSRSLALFEQHVGRRSRSTLQVAQRLGRVYSLQGRFDELEELLRRNHDATLSEFGAEDPATLTAANNLGLLLTRRGKHREAEVLLRSVVTTRLRVLGEGNETTQASMSNLGIVYYNLEEYGEAERWVRRELSLCAERLGQEHVSTLTSRANLANLLARTGRVAEGASAMGDVVESSRRIRGAGHVETLHAAISLANIFRAGGEFERAEQELRRVFRDGAESPKESGVMVRARQDLARLRLARGTSLTSSGHFEEAEHALIAAFEQFEREQPDGQDRRDAVAALVRLFEECGDAEAASDWRDR
ncbi:MAG: tetratricopeptide repeat protein [bacterium]|nr:tetratricopeptide repeat protein [bacterium]